MKKCGFIAVIAMMFFGMAGAATTNFNDTTGNHLWSTVGNWSAGVPTAANAGVINGLNQCIIDGNMVGASKAIAYTISVGTVAASNSSLTVIGDCNIAITPATQGIYSATVLNNSTATINFQSGNVIAGRSFFGNGGVAYINLNGSNVTTRSNTTAFAGVNGNAAIDTDVTMTAGTLSTGHAYLGYAGACRFNMSGGTFNTGTLTLFIGQGNATLSGASEMNVSGTAAVSATKIVVGAAASSSGKLNISGGTVVAPTVVLCEAGTPAPTGILNISGGSLTAATALKVGVVTGTGKIIMTGGTLTAGTTTLPVVTTAVADVNLVGGVMTVSSLVMNTGGHIDVKGGTLKLLGDKRTDVSTLISDGKLTGYGWTRTLIVGYDGTYTIVTADEQVGMDAYNYAPTSVSIFDQDSVVLSWSPGDGAVQHAIYFGSLFADVNTATTSTTGIYKTTQTGLSYPLNANLDPGKTYYWRIDELDGSGNLIMKGRVWSFTIQSSYTVDNFELYMDTAALQVVWNSQGTLEVNPAGVGGHDSAKSMIIDYNNSLPPYYTEVTRDYGSYQDWTLGNLESLVLYFHVDKGNAAGKIYVKLDDGTKSKVVYYDDPDAVTEYWRGWQFLQIELAEFSTSGVNLSEVRKVTVGVSQNPPAAGGGSGTVYVDDILLYPVMANTDIVNFIDYSTLANSWLTADANVSLDGDDDVDIYDLALFVSRWLSSDPQTIPGAATGTIYATPQHLVIAKGTTASTTLTWSTSGCTSAQVYVSVNGGSESLVSTSTGRSLAVNWIGSGAWYVFKLYEGTAHTTLLAWTSVTSHIPPDYSVGFSYWPYERANNSCLNDENWYTFRPIVERDLDQMSSMGVDHVRFLIWPGYGWSLSSGLNADYYEQTENIVDLLSLVAARGMQAWLVFGNSYQDIGNGTPGHYWWMNAYDNNSVGYTEFLLDTKEWIDGYVNAIESSSYKTTVFAYDIGSEYKRQVTNEGWYIRFLLDHSAIPFGKRNVSVLRIDGNTDLTDLAYQLTISPHNGVARRLDFVDFRIYPDNYYLHMPVEEARNTCQSVFPHSTIFMGESGYFCANSINEPNQQNAILDVLEQVDNMAAPIPYYCQWRLWDGSTSGDYGWGYSPHSPKDILGGMSDALGLVYNGDMEIVSSGKPGGWDSGGTVTVALTSGTGYAEAATNTYYGRLTANSSTGSVWMTSSVVTVSGGKKFYANAYMRSNMKNISISVVQYDANMNYIATSTGPTFTPSGWSWNDYLPRAGTWSASLNANTRKVIVSINGTCQANPAYLDVDAVSAWER